MVSQFWSSEDKFNDVVRLYVQVNFYLLIMPQIVKAHRFSSNDWHPCPREEGLRQQSRLVGTAKLFTAKCKCLAYFQHSNAFVTIAAQLHVMIVLEVLHRKFGYMAIKWIHQKACHCIIMSLISDLSGTMFWNANFFKKTLFNAENWPILLMILMHIFAMLTSFFFLKVG